jgi:hypothetical protein
MLISLLLPRARIVICYLLAVRELGVDNTPRTRNACLWPRRVGYASSVLPVSLTGVEAGTRYPRLCTAP